MKAVVIYEPGGPEKLIYTDVPKPEIKEGWSLVKIQGFGINHSEIFTRNGLSPNVKFPRILGIECVGVIAETTDEARLPVGRQVVSIMGEMGRAFDGSYAEYALLPNAQLYPVHADKPIDILAAIPETCYTAYGSMLNLKLTEGDRVLVRGATSGVGVAFVKLVKARYPRLKIAGTTRKLQQAQQLLDEGYDEVVADINNVLQTDDSYDKILELVGPASLRDTFSHTGEGGIICSTGQLGGIWYLNEFDPIEQLPPNAYLTSFYSGNVNGEKLQAMLDYIDRFSVDVRPVRVFTLEEVPKAHEFIENSGGFGKVVVVNA